MSTSVDRTSRPVSLTCVQHHIDTFFDENSGHGNQLSTSYNGDDCSLSPIPNVVHSPRHGQHNRKNRNVRLKLPRRTIGEKENNNGSITVLVYMHSQKIVFFWSWSFSCIYCISATLSISKSKSSVSAMPATGCSPVTILQQDSQTFR